jgi:hypothetical protein
MLNLNEIPDRLLVGELRDRGYSVTAKTINTMVRLNGPDVERIKGDQTWAELVTSNWARIRQMSDLVAVHKLAITPGGDPIKVALRAEQSRLVLDLQKRWGTNISETIRVILYLADESSTPDVNAEEEQDGQE